MKLRKTVLSIFLALTLITMPVSRAQGITRQNPENNTQQVTVETMQLDGRAIVLKNYLAQKNSPLQYYAQDFIDAADFYQLDWKLVPAISGVESTFGKAIPGGYNGWGWGVYGNQALAFNSWRDGIFTVSKGLRENYINKGLTNPYSMNRIYAASPTWGSKVTFFLEDIDKYAKISNIPGDKQVQNSNVENKTAGSSARLSIKPSAKLAIKI